MLKEFLQHQKELPIQNITNEKKLTDLTTRTFDNMVDFLRNPQTFPNSRINEMVTLMWRLIGNKEITVVLDLDNNIPSAAFAVLEQDDEKIPFLILPGNYVDYVKENPISELGVVAYMSSQCRDLYTGKINGDNTEVVNKRARAYESEALQTMQQLASEEKFGLEFTPFQRTILEELPEGLKSLPENLDYATPPYPRNADVGYRYN